MSYIKVWIHYVWATKNNKPVLNKEIRDVLYPHMLDNARKKGIWLDTVNGFTDHVHCLISLGKEETLAKVAQLLKGESSNWLNKQVLGAAKFGWQDDYYAVSVSESQVGRVRNYIRRQEAHHKKKTFGEEVDEFMKHRGWRHLG